MIVVEISTAAPGREQWCRGCGSNCPTVATWCPHRHEGHEIVWRPVVIEIEGVPASRSGRFEQIISRLSDEERDELRKLGLRV